MKDIDLSTKKKLIIFATLGLMFWGMVAWLFISVPTFIIDLLPPLLPFTIFAFLLFLAGLILLTIAAMPVVRSISPRYAWTIILLSASIIVLYNLSPLAPSWNCWGKRLYVLTVKAGQTCTTVCTNNKKKPCGGWSDCWGGKDISCSSAGKDQDGRNCNGCCFSCDVVCEDDDPPPPSYSHPTITAGLSCSLSGNNGWCKANETITMTASDPQGFALTISGDIAGTPFTCAAGTACMKYLPVGSGTVNYTVTAATSGLTASGSIPWKLDTTYPTATISIPSPTGSNGWFKTLPVVVSVTGSDTYSGLAVARLSTDTITWQPSSITFSSEGKYIVWYGADDLAGNRSDYSGQFVNIDTTSPNLTPSVSGTMGANGWYVSNVVVDASATDNLSGISSVVVSDNGGAAKQVPVTLTSGTHALTITAKDVAGNSRSTTLDLTIDTDGPIITPSVIGTEGNNKWYVSDVDVTVTVSDPGSGMDGTLEVLVDSGTWTTELPLHFREGQHTVDLRAYDEAGNESTKTLAINVDTTPPVLSTSTTGTPGNAGWYVSDATTSITASDSTSGIDYIEYKQNSASWKNGNSVLSNDGANTITARVYDLAGNSASKSLEVKVDTVPPAVVPVIPTPTGLENWFVSVPVIISANGADATSGLLGALVSVDDMTRKDSISLSDGLYTATFRSEDIAGNTTSVPLDLQIDATKPTLEISTSGTAGKNGWYTSQTTTAFKADDKTSGVDRVEYSQNNSTWQTGTSVVSKDGINSISVKAYDKAGNVLSGQAQVKVDTGMPINTFTSPANGSTDTLARNTLHLSGTASDTLSGIASVELSNDDGKTWVPTTLSANGKWSYDFDTTKVPDGIYTLIVRTMDVAGNTVVGKEDSGAHITVIINNAPPHIQLTPEWFIWDRGELVIKTEYFPLKSGTLTISDPQHRWPKVEIPFDEKYPSTIAWDRRFANGVLAPIGNYHVDVKACNLYNLCSSKPAVIKIPWISVIVPTVSPVVPILTPEKPAVGNIPEQSETQIPPIVAVEDFPLQVQIPNSVERKPANIALWLAALIALMWAVASAALSDRRPVAINAITKTIQQKQNP
jgi:hypothetical protein